MQECVDCGTDISETQYIEHGGLCPQCEWLLGK